MTGYKENIDAVVQNLEDAGCDKDLVIQFMELGKSGKKQGQVHLLERHRRTLLDKIQNSRLPEQEGFSMIKAMKKE